MGLLLAYVLTTAIRRKPIRIRQWEFPVPPLSLTVGQVVVTCVDLTLAGSVLYVLLPASLGLSFPAVMGIYVLAVIIGLASQVPGGLGVFETAFVHLLPADVPASAVVGSLLAFRGVYFLLPLAVAALLMAAHEVAFISRRVPDLRDGFVRWLSTLVPPTLAFLMFAAGVVLLLSNAATAAARMQWLSAYLPVRIIALSHFLGGVVGIVLVLLAYAVQRRLDTAYWVSLTILVTGAVLALLKGFNYEVAIVLTVTAAALLPCHQEFYRKAAFIREPATPVWLAAIAVVIFCAAWLGLF
jgi:phosphatidylglycerol lysyltransferase